MASRSARGPSPRRRRQRRAPTIRERPSPPPRDASRYGRRRRARTDPPPRGEVPRRRSTRPARQLRAARRVPPDRGAGSDIGVAESASRDSPLACSSSEGARREGASLFRRAPPVTCDSGFLALSSGVARHLAYLESMRAIASQPHALDSSTGRFPRVSRVGIRAGVEKRARDGEVSPKRREVCRRLSRVVPRVEIRAALDQPRDDVRSRTPRRGGGGGGGRDGTRDGYVERSFDVSVNLRETSGKTACVSGPTTPPQLARLAWWSGVRPATSGRSGRRPLRGARSRRRRTAGGGDVGGRASEKIGLVRVFASSESATDRLGGVLGGGVVHGLASGASRADLRAAGSPVVSSEADGILGVTTTAGDGGGRLRLPRALDARGDG